MVDSCFEEIKMYKDMNGLLHPNKRSCIQSALNTLIEKNLGNFHYYDESGSEYDTPTPDLNKVSFVKVDTISACVVVEAYMYINDIESPWTSLGVNARPRPYEPDTFYWCESYWASKNEIETFLHETFDIIK